MNAKAKIVLHMGVTLIIGIAIGAMLNRAIVQKHIRGIMERRAAGMFLPVRDILASATPEQEPKPWPKPMTGSAARSKPPWTISRRKSSPC
jgi:uncharacterized membrane protein YfcA